MIANIKEIIELAAPNYSNEILSGINDFPSKEYKVIRTNDLLILYGQFAQRYALVFIDAYIYKLAIVITKGNSGEWYNPQKIYIDAPKVIKDKFIDIDAEMTELSDDILSLYRIFQKTLIPYDIFCLLINSQTDMELTITDTETNQEVKMKLVDAKTEKFIINYKYGKKEIGIVFYNYDGTAYVAGIYIPDRKLKSDLRDDMFKLRIPLLKKWEYELN